MNIVAITPGFNANEADLGIPCLASLVTKLASRHRMTVLALEYPPQDEDYLLGDIPVLPLGPGRFATTLCRAYSRLKRRDIEEHIDLIHVFFAGRSGAIASIIARCLGRPLIMTVMGGELVQDSELGYGGARSSLSRACSYLALSSAHRVITLSSCAVRTIPARFRDKQLTIPFGVDPTVFYPAERRDSAGRPFQILTVGSLTAVKGHMFLLVALARMKARHRVELHVVGDGPLKTNLMTLAVQLGIANIVRFHGELPHASLPHLYRTSDALVVASIHETQSMVAVEAAMCGCLVVGTRVGILPELLPNRLLALPGDVDSLALALDTAVCGTTPGDFKRIRTVALERCNLSTQAAVLEQCYKAAIAANV